VILAIQEAEIRRITVRSQARQTVPRDPTLKKTFTKKGWWSDSSVGPEFKPQYHTQKRKR
jgi:hypothetical protein